MHITGNPAKPGKSRNTCLRKWHLNWDWKDEWGIGFAKMEESWLCKDGGEYTDYPSANINAHMIPNSHNNNDDFVSQISLSLRDFVIHRKYQNLNVLIIKWINISILHVKKKRQKQKEKGRDRERNHQENGTCHLSVQYSLIKIILSVLTHDALSHKLLRSHWYYPSLERHGSTVL